MSVKDRTPEFASVVQSLRSRQTVRGVQPKNARQRALKQHSEFSLIAKRIGADIAQTCLKLEKLALLAKRKSLFDDRPVEIQELTYIIKQDIGALNRQISRLQTLQQTHNRADSVHAAKHSTNVVVSLQTKLATVSSDFKSVLELRTQNLRNQKERVEQFTSLDAIAAPGGGGGRAGASGSSLFAHNGGARGHFNGGANMGGVGARERGVSGGATAGRKGVMASSSSSPPLFASGARANKSGYPRDDSSSETSVNVNMPGSGDGVGMESGQMQLVPTSGYAESRANAVEAIESTIVELGSIFQQLAHMVQAQGEQVERIDANADETEMNVERAHGELLKYFENISSNRWLMIKVFGVLILFFIFFVVFMA